MNGTSGRAAVLGALAWMLAGCASAPAGNAGKGDAEKGDAEVRAVRDMMVGTYSSGPQAGRDTDFFDISLVMTPIWTERAGEYWLYVEQAAADKKDKPYRQRVYRVVRVGDAIESRVYVLPGNPLDHAAAWKQPKPLGALKPSDLSERTGCGVFMTRAADGSYAGATRGTACASELRGAAYATAKVTLTGATLTSWDQGFDASGKQVWGSTKGPYVFTKHSSKVP